VIYIPVDEVWRREAPCLDTSAHQQERRPVADRALPVCACNVYRLPRKGDILQQAANALKAGLDGHVQVQVAQAA
jgi:hypothetical protein